MPRKQQQADVLAVIGAQYGSEGKGVIVAHLADRYQVHVRVGGPNAGHSFYHHGVKHVQQMIPCGWVNPNATLIIGAGALISLEVLTRELCELEQYDQSIWDRLYIDPRAGVISSAHHAIEGGVDGDLHRRIGSTGEGVGAARLDRIKRDPHLFKDFERATQLPEWEHLRGLSRENTSVIIQNAVAAGRNVLLEGTQGSGLSLVHGPWPYVTSADTNAAQFAADVGLPPRMLNRCLLVARTFPIRVAGNSGPLSHEMTWEEMSRLVGYPVEERTTVTKKVRRIGQWDDTLYDRAVALNAPTSVAITFADYLCSDDAGKTEWEALSPPVRRFVQYVETRWGTPVGFVGTGGEQWSVVDRGKRA
jgi:adenylosuccinate synthase